MVYKSSFIIALAGILLCGCNQSKDLQMWEKAPVVATRTSLNGQDLVALDVSLLKDTIVFPLSFFMEELNFVKLENSDEAIIYPAGVEISDNYILIKSGRPRTNSFAEYRAAKPIPCKLFDKTGKFIAEIGGIGQGPGEYTMIYSTQIDEKNQRIYLMPWSTDKILVYDFTGKVLEPIRMPYRTPKAVFKVQGDRVAIAIIPFENNPSVVWVQTTGGEVIKEIPSGHFTVSDFSNEIFSGQNTEDIDISFWNYPSRVDSLYHINMQTGEFTAKFTADFHTDVPASHSYTEWPDYYLGNTQAPVMISDGNGSRQEGEAPAFYIVDKKSLKGSFLRIDNDYLDGEPMGWPIGIFDKGYHIRNMEPGALLDWIEKILKSDKVDEKMRTKLVDLQNSIDEDDNNYIVYGKMKK